MYIRKDLCDLCGSCVAVCPVDAITLDEYRADIDTQICTKCGNCQIICPAKAIETGSVQ